MTGVVEKLKMQIYFQWTVKYSVGSRLTYLKSTLKLTFFIKSILNLTFLIKSTVNFFLTVNW